MSDPFRLCAMFPSPFRPHMTEGAGAAAPNISDKNKAAKVIVAGAITGGLEICISYPTEFIKTQLQLDEKVRKYKGIWDCVKQTIQERGVRGLYRGLPVLLLGSVPRSAVRFSAFEACKDMCVDENLNLPMSKRLLCGLGAGISEAIIAVTPMETVKVKFIADRRLEKPQYKGLFHGVRTIIATEGVSGVYKGVTATMMKQGTNQAIRFFVMETCNQWYRDGDVTKPIPKLVVGGFGGFAGFCSVIANNPLDVIKTRMQSLDAAKYKNTWDCAKTILINEGPGAFYKGTSARMMRVVLNVSLSFVFFESFMDLFDYYLKKSQP